MRDAFSLIWLVLIGLFRSRASLQVEIVTLRHQLNVLRRKSPQRLGARFVYAMTCKSLEEARLKASEAFPAFGGSQTFFNIAPTSFAPTVKVEADDGELGYVAQLYSQEKKFDFNGPVQSFICD